MDSLRLRPEPHWPAPACRRASSLRPAAWAGGQPLREFPVERRAVCHSGDGWTRGQWNLPVRRAVFNRSTKLIRPEPSWTRIVKIRHFARGLLGDSLILLRVFCKISAVIF